MSTPTIIALLAGNFVSIALGVGTLIGWLRNWLLKQVQEPINAISRRVDTVEKVSTRAHKRLDEHLERSG